MTENVRKIFDMIDVEPNEKFKIKYDGKIYDKYYINKYLKLICDKENFITSFTVLDVIRGDIEIIKTPILSDKEQRIINNLFELGFHYMARDNDRGYTLYAYKTLPEQDHFYSWNTNEMDYVKIDETEDNLFDFIKIKDNEPLFIDEYVKNDKEYETDKEKIKEKMIEIHKQIRITCNNTPCSNCNYYADMNIDCTHKMAIDELIKNNFTFLKSEE